MCVCVCVYILGTKVWKLKLFFSLKKMKKTNLKTCV